MTRQQFIDHEWFEGETVYVIKYKTRGAIEIPYKVSRYKVKKIDSSSSFYIDSKEYPMYFSTLYRSYKDLFTSRKEASDKFETIKKEFIKTHRYRVADMLHKERSEICRECYRQMAQITGLLRLKIMNE